MVQYALVETFEEIARAKSVPIAYMDKMMRWDPQDVVADGGWRERGSIRFVGVRVYGYG